MFNERVHAWIAAQYYVALKNHFQDRGLEAFTYATIYYATQRGRRMAMRAIRDGQALTPKTYARYGEWVNSTDAVEEGIQNQSEVLERSPDLVTRITKCPWHQEFVTLGLTDTAGAAYCKYLDISIMQGFNPQLTYEVDQTLQTADCCIHRIKNVDYNKHTDLSKRMAYVQSWDYHCAHSFYAYKEVSESIFQEEGKAVSGEVLTLFRSTYGQAMADVLEQYRSYNFNLLSD